MSIYDTEYHTTLSVLHYGPGAWYLNLPKAMRDRLKLMKDAQIEIAVIRVLPPPVKEE